MGDYEDRAPVEPQKRYSYDLHLDPELHFDSQGIRERAEELMAEILAAHDLDVA